MEQKRTVKELIEFLSPNKNIEIRWIWLPSKRWAKDEGGWYYREGENNVYPLDLDIDDDPTQPQEDDEYSYSGPAGDFFETMSGYDFIFDEEIDEELEDGIYAIYRFAIDA